MLSKRENTHKRASHQKTGKNEEVGGRNNGSVQDSRGRRERRSSWTAESGVSAHSWSIPVTHLCHICTEQGHIHGALPGGTHPTGTKQVRSCSRRAFTPADSLHRETASRVQVDSVSFVTCRRTAHFGVWSPLPEATCAMGEQTPRSSFLTKSGSSAQHPSLLSQSGKLGSRGCLGPEGCHSQTEPHVQTRPLRTPRQGHEDTLLQKRLMAK